MMRCRGKLGSAPSEHAVRFAEWCKVREILRALVGGHMEGRVSCKASSVSLVVGSALALVRKLGSN